MEGCHVPAIVARTLAARGIATVEEAERFLTPSLERDWADPLLIPGMGAAADRVERALDAGESIAVFGDFDVDGMSATCLLTLALRELGGRVQPYIPNRFGEGYGLSRDALARVIEGCHPDLIVTVDNGIASRAEVDWLKTQGIDVVVTDHHEPAETIPKAIAVIDCKRKDSKYPFRELAGCGVAFKLTQAFCKKLNLEENLCLKNLDLACIGTISDIVPLVDENRSIAKLGLMLVNQTKNMGLRELIKSAGYKKITSESVSFGLSPRINASGRMGHQEDALDLFLTNDPIKARNLAKKLEEYNSQRQEIEKRIYEEAVSKVEQEGNTKKCIVLGSENWHHGIIGIVSSKITDKYYKPSILVCFEGEDAKGSGRSIKGFDLHEATEKCKADLTACGGHSMAVGVSLKTANFEKFKDDFERYANDNITDEMLNKTINIDEVITKKDATLESIKDLKLLEPYGEGNKKAVVLYRNLKIDSIRTLTDGKHLKLLLEDEGNYIDAMGFGMGNLVEDYIIGDRIDVVGNIEINTYNGRSKVQMLIIDLRKSV